MNNDLEQFSEERLKNIIEPADNPTMVSLARIALAAKQAKPVNSPCEKCKVSGFMDSGGTQPWGEPISVECDCTTQQPAHTEQDGWIKCGDRVPEELDKNYQVVALSVKKYDEGNYIGEPKKTIVQDWVIRLHPLNFTH